MPVQRRSAFLFLSSPALILTDLEFFKEDANRSSRADCFLLHLIGGCVCVCVERIEGNGGWMCNHLDVLLIWLFCLSNYILCSLQPEMSLKWHLLLNTVSSLSAVCLFGGVSWCLCNFLVYVREICSVCMHLYRRHQRKKSFGFKISRYRNITTQSLSNPVCLSASFCLFLWLPFILPCSQWSIIWIKCLHNKISVVHCVSVLISSVFVVSSCYGEDSLLKTSAWTQHNSRERHAKYDFTKVQFCQYQEPYYQVYTWPLRSRWG